MERLLRPEATERSRIKKAMRGARFLKWTATPIASLAMIAAIFIGMRAAWYIGVIAFIIVWAALFIFASACARCPHCGQIWGRLGDFGAWWFMFGQQAADKDETESFVCRRCRLDIGYGLRD